MVTIAQLIGFVAGSAWFACGAAYIREQAA